jgi:arsenate reductase (thioredoxin)
MLMRSDGCSWVDTAYDFTSSWDLGKSGCSEFETQWQMGILPNIEPQDSGLAHEEFRLGGDRNLTEQVLFVCVENAGRSQMAEGFARAYALDASSAGTLPAEKVNRVVVEAMKERGIALLEKPKMLTEQMIREADLVVTMGCSVGEVCPRPLVEHMEKELVDWHIEDPQREIARSEKDQSPD